MSVKSKSTKKGDVSEEITLSFLTKFIKTYSGDRESLPAFLTNCENAISLANSEQQPILCKFIISQLEGKAQVACSLKTFSSWEELKLFLRSTFGEKKHATHLLSDLQHSKQLPGEDVTKYSLRVESILTRIQSDIHYSCKDDRELPGRIAAMEDLALNSFLLGLNPSISTIVRCKNPTTLSDAIQYATDEEKLFNVQRNNSRSQKQCNICNKFGHSSNECFKNKKHSSNSNSHPRTFHINPQSNINRNSNFINKSCNYCKLHGHTINECRKRKFNMQRRRQAEYTQHDSTSRNSNAQVNAIYDRENFKESECLGNDINNLN